MAKATKLPSGNWRCKAYYTDEYGRYKSKSFTEATKKLAEFKANEFLMEREHASKPENKTLGELADRYIDNQSEILSPSTIRGYRSIRHNAFASIIDMRVGLLTKELYQKAVNDYSVGRSPKTVLSAHAFFNKVLTDNEITVGNGAKLPPRAKKEIEIPSTEEMVAFLKSIKSTRLYLYCLFSVCLGLRKSETIALQWTDIDLEKKTVIINKARVRDEIGSYVEKSPKTFSGTRTLHIPQLLIDALQSEKDQTGAVIKDSPKALESLYQRQKTRSNFPYNFHALRHYYASVMLLSGLPNRYARERMGHATEDMLVNVYQHTFKSEQEKHDILLDNFFTENLVLEPEEK